MEYAQETNSSDNLEKRIENFAKNFAAVESELSKVLVGMKETMRLTLAAVFAGGHVLLEGAPGLGKTLLVKSLAKTMGLTFNRIQFTSDLMPADITGTQILTQGADGDRKFVFKPGPVFANIVLADEVNRAGPKTQSALLEAMEEKQVSVLGESHPLPDPFFVLATQNPVELEGTYPLPEAQLDRFIVKIQLPGPTPSELKEILSRTTGQYQAELEPMLPPAKTVEILFAMRQLVRQVVVAPPLEDFLVGIIFALTPESQSSSDEVHRYVRFGPGPRGAQSVLLIAKVFALLNNRVNLAVEDIKASIVPALRHRLILNFQAEADGVTAEQIIADISDAN